MAASAETRHDDASSYLRQIDDDWVALITSVGPCTIITNEDREPHEALMRAIAYQQLAVRAADTIVGRMLALYPEVHFPAPAQLLETDDAVLRACGFSFRKIATLKTIAEAALSGVVPTRAEADTMSDAELIERLVSLKGIGRWTVEMFLMFTLGRHDVLPVDDFGVREGYRLLKSLDAQPTPKALREIALPWAPYRTVASWYLWRVPRRRAGIMT
jgi:DNA-3-methyladenine glycosylase II